MANVPCGYCTNGKVSFRTSIADAKCFRCNGKGTRWISQDDLDAIEVDNAAEAAAREAAFANRMTDDQSQRIAKAAMLMSTSPNHLMKLAIGRDIGLCIIDEDETRANADLTIAFAIKLWRMKPAERKRVMYPAVQKMQVAA